MQGAQVQSLVGELDPTCHAATKSLRAATKHASMKILGATTKTQCSLNKQILKKEKKKEAAEKGILLRS